LSGPARRRPSTEGGSAGRDGRRGRRWRLRRLSGAAARYSVAQRLGDGLDDADADVGGTLDRLAGGFDATLDGAGDDADRTRFLGTFTDPFDDLGRRGDGIGGAFDGTFDAFLCRSQRRQGETENERQCAFTNSMSHWGCSLFV
jgi:hypothetical protein